MVERPVAGRVSLRLTSELAAALEKHLFPGDGDEHGAVIGAAVVETENGCRLLGRRLFLAEDSVDYVPSTSGYRMLSADFVRRCALACADEGLAYLAVHNHFGGDSVEFSDTDIASHQRGYPALLDILDGPPVGGLVFAGKSVAGDIWMSADQQRKLSCAAIVGRSQALWYPAPPRPADADPLYDRQVRLFGDRGQEILASQKVGIIGAGGTGSLINEYLARLGVGHLIVVDYDRLDETNFPRVVGARLSDLGAGSRWGPLSKLIRRRPAYKVSISERVAREANRDIEYDVQRQLLLPVPSIILAGSPPVSDCAAGPLRCGSWGRRIPG